jgi:hypothetical protein
LVSSGFASRVPTRDTSPNSLLLEKNHAVASHLIASPATFVYFALIAKYKKYKQLASKMLLQQPVYK